MVYENANTNAKDLKTIRDSLSDLSERLRFYFKSLSMEDNFSPEQYLSFKQTGEQLAAIELAADGLVSTYADLSADTASQLQVLTNRISLKVSKGDVSNQLNLEPDALRISGNRLEIYGDNITLDVNNNLTIKGEVTATAGTIAGWTIAADHIEGNSNSKITCTTLQTDNHISVLNAEVSGDSSFQGCTGEFVGTNLETDDNTYFTSGFTADTFDVFGEAIVGTTRVYESVDVNGQITCRSCRTTADGKTWSDRRLKEDIQELSLDEAEGILRSLIPYRYQFIKDNEKSCGFIAQEVRQAQRGQGEDYGLVREGENLSLSYIGLIPFLVRKIQEQTRAIDELSG